MPAFNSRALLLLFVLGHGWAACRAGEPGGPSDTRAFRQGLAGQTVMTDLTLTRNIEASGGSAIVLGADSITLDCAGHTLSGDGTGTGIEATDRSRVTITNCVIEGFDTGIHLASTDGMGEQLLSAGNAVRGNMVRGNRHGVFLMWSHGAEISGNRILENSDSAISLTGHPSRAIRCSNNALISGNEISFNRRGLVTWCPYLPQEGNVVRNNTFFHNAISVTDRFESVDRITYASNVFADNLTTVFLRFSGDHDARAGRPVDFELGVYRSDGSACSDFEILSMESTPAENLSFTKADNRIGVRFTPERSGMYSIAAALRGCGQETISQRFWFGTEKSMTYYLNPGPRRDVGTLLDQPPAEPVRVWCTMWVEAGIRFNPPDSGVAKITGLRSSMWSNYFPFADSSPYENLWGIEFDHTYSRRGDIFVSIDGKHEKGRVRVAEDIGKGIFVYEDADWQDVTVKYWARDPDWTHTPDAPSSVELRYLISDSPPIRQVSNPNAWLLSATARPGSPGTHEIVLNGLGPTSLKLPMGDDGGNYRVEVDGVRCGPATACRYRQDGSTLTISVDLPGNQRTLDILDVGGARVDNGEPPSVHWGEKREKRGRAGPSQPK